MKQSTITIALLLFCSFSVAQNQETESSAPRKKATRNVQIETGIGNYLMGLRSNNGGIVESSIMGIVKLKILYPHIAFREIEGVLDSLVTNGKTPAVRYKAYLASNVCENPLWFADQRELQHLRTDEFFVPIAKKLQERMLGLHTQQ